MKPPTILLCLALASCGTTRSDRLQLYSLAATVAGQPALGTALAGIASAKKAREVQP